MEDDSSPPPIRVTPQPLETPPPRRRLPALFWSVLVLGLAGGIYYAIRRYDMLSNNMRTVPHYPGQIETKADLYSALADSAAVYVGLPVILALGLSLTPRTRSAMGATMKGITIALLLAAPVFQEGYVCIIMAAPIFYIIGALIAWPMDRARKHRDRASKLQAAFVTMVLAVLALEGTMPETSFPRETSVTRSRVVDAGIDQVRGRLAAPLVIPSERPFFLHLFPSASATSGSGLAIGDTRRATFVAYKHIWWDRVQGDLTMHVAESSPDHVRFAVDGDDSYIGHYLEWENSIVDLQPVDATHTKVSWTLQYRRTLDPVWYFGPLQRYAVGLTAAKLIDDLCDPAA